MRDVFPLNEGFIHIRITVTSLVQELLCRDRLDLQVFCQCGVVARPQSAVGAPPFVFYACVHSRVNSGLLLGALCARLQCNGSFKDAPAASFVSQRLRRTGLAHEKVCNLLESSLCRNLLAVQTATKCGRARQSLARSTPAGHQQWGSHGHLGCTPNGTQAQVVTFQNRVQGRGRRIPTVM